LDADLYEEDDGLDAETSSPSPPSEQPSPQQEQQQPAAPQSSLQSASQSQSQSQSQSLPAHPWPEPAQVMYILTLGTAHFHRRRGVAQALLRRQLRHALAAADFRCRAVFLHVITYNDAAISFYR
jgi:ribosomal protein S18 acetylase RimI-like enzyme